MQNETVYEKQIDLKGVPALLFTPRVNTKTFPTILFYHGWGSNKESQRFRGFILATLGFQVIIPDALFHGQRHPIDHDLRENSEKYFWKIVLQNIEESEGLIQEAIDRHNADANNIGIAGHSMGGITASGIYTQNQNIKALAVINGSCAWNHTNHLFSEILGLSDSTLNTEEDTKLNRLDPMNHLDTLPNRPILLLHGDRDSIVPIESQRIFYHKIEPLYTKKEKIRFIEYPRLNHYLTTNMMEEIYNFFKLELVSQTTKYPTT